MTLILWSVGASLALFFGTLGFLYWRDKRAEKHFPIAVYMLPSEVTALKAAHVHVPRSFFTPRKASHLIGLRLTKPELFQLQSVVMGLAQARIARAARAVRDGRGSGSLGGHTHSFGTLASYLTEICRKLNIEPEEKPPTATLAKPETMPYNPACVEASQPRPH